jgi:hypothetical protein
MKPRCQHSPQFVRAEPNGEDRVIKHYACRHCGKESRRNLKKPRYVPYSESLAKKGTKSRKTVKASQNRPVGKRKAIRQVSAKRKNWLKQYEAKTRAEGPEVTIWELFNPANQRPFLAKTKDLKSRWKVEPHHPLGRVGCRVLFYVWVTPELHRFIHENAEIARSRGWILPEMSGRESKAGQPDQFNILPEYHAYLSEHGLH